MKRSLFGCCLSVLWILGGFTGCKPEPGVCGLLPDGGKGDPEALTEGPQACADRGSLGFAQEFGSGTFIIPLPDGGVRFDEDTLAIRNGGIADLHITSASLSGDTAFSLTISNESNPDAGEALPADVKGNDHFYMRVRFFPREARQYNATITVQSNAENTPSRDFAISGCGVPTDGGRSPCYRDGGT
ncbi:MAG: hypothetical protein Q8L48_26405 [Archangium sp.]|nr:hypothetical protein [Archangium sp.]